MYEAPIIAFGQQYHQHVKFCTVIYHASFLSYCSQFVPRCIAIIQREVLEYFLKFPKREWGLLQHL